MKKQITIEIMDNDSVGIAYNEAWLESSDSEQLESLRLGIADLSDYYSRLLREEKVAV